VSTIEEKIELGLIKYFEITYPKNKIQIIDLSSITDGWETEIYSFTLLRDDKQKELILRMYSGTHSSKKARNEYENLKKLYKIGYPVPKVFFIETDIFHFDKPFIIMEMIKGTALYELMRSSPDKHNDYLNIFCKLFFDLHSLDWHIMIDDNSDYDFSDPYRYINDLLSSYQDEIEKYKRFEFMPLLNWLKARIHDVPQERISVVHRDFHPNNILINSGGDPFVIDWTAIGITDFRVDLGWTLLLMGTFGDQKIHNAIIKGYEQYSGKKLEKIEYFEILAILRRLFDIYVSFKSSATERGMREGALDMMRQSLDHIKKVYALLQEKTNLAIVEIEELLEKLSKNN